MHRINVISCSWGVTGSAFPQTVAEIEDAVTFGREGKGCVIVASAGGNTQDEAIYFPASSPNALSVGAITCKGWRAGFSCYGPALDVMAPGADIYTTYLGGGCNDWFSGSSASCPHVAGIAVLILSVNKCLKHDEVRKIIELSCEKVHRDSIYNYTYSSYHKNGTWNNEMGHGLVNAYKALLYAMASPHDTTVSGYTYNVSEILDWTYESNSFCDNYNFQEGTHKVKRYEIRATVQYDYTISPVIQGIANGFSDNTQLNRGCYFMDIVSYSETEATVRTYVYEKINPATGATLGWIPTHPDEVRFNVHVTCDNLQYELLLQNHTETGTKTYNVITGIAAGKNVNSNEPVGNYTIISRANVSMHAGETILLADGFTASAGSFFHAYIEPFFTCTNTTTRGRGCDNEYVYVIKDYSVEKSDVQNLETEALGNELYLKLYPNPSTGNVTVEYNLNSSAVVEITLHDNSGKPVYTLKNRTPHDAGVYKITLSGVELPAGIYYCTLKTEKEQKTEKLMIVR